MIIRAPVLSKLWNNCITSTKQNKNLRRMIYVCDNKNKQYETKFSAKFIHKIRCILFLARLPVRDPSKSSVDAESGLGEDYWPVYTVPELYHKEMSPELRVGRALIGRALIEPCRQVAKSWEIVPTLLSVPICLYKCQCYVMLCYIMLCYVMLCYVMLCYVMLCYVML